MLPEGYVLHDEVTGNLPPERQERILAKSRRMLLGLELRELREQLQMTQTQVAEAMGVKQPTVNRMEARGGEIKLSTLKRYVEALGGSLEISVRFPAYTTKLTI